MTHSLKFTQIITLQILLRMEYFLTRMFVHFFVQYIENSFYRLDVVHVLEQSLSEGLQLLDKLLVFGDRTDVISQNLVVRWPVVLASRTVAIEEVILQYLLLPFVTRHVRVHAPVTREYLIAGSYGR